MATQLLQTTILNEQFLKIDYSQYTSAVAAIHHHLEESKDELTGWVNTPLEEKHNLIDSIQTIANEIKVNADVLVVIGIGGSYLGAKAIQDALTPYFGKQPNGIEVIYAGQNMSGAYINQLLTSLADKEVYINVISKSGSTMEPALAFRVLRQYMEERYGEDANQRIIVTTDPEIGFLREIAETHNYRQFLIPPNIGGRYSVLTPVGLLPIAVAGVEIKQLLDGAKEAATLLKEGNLEENEAYRYAVIRHALYSLGYKVELLASFEPALANFHDWWKQLFGESEGKDQKGLFPATVNYSTDLHAIGQFIQDGSPILFETLLHFHEITDDYRVPFDARDEDRLNYLSNRSFNSINAISKQGTALAHAEGGIPVIQLELKKLDAYHLGYLVYFFMKACAMSAYLIEVNPFDQPGVEAYKGKMLELLNTEDKKVDLKG
ncbi:glucose-6-phosphate isomerase [Lysinibacillus sp. SGAir0095]|uniref:glucose-6-phosphate isomerase n=1 Tax=Lysinibacillus sp. SGAir0095 TaxID=2070463 RepID=UPI0010CCC753|nr:glucose-6-phosphate isomerase [Lysinibacillus sp. SGAir0095]QCR31883.1 glucose-6-phosphate isomerase [Lysinibacillus sp. SGAir0095]